MKSQNYIRNLFSKERILLFAILVATFISYFQIVNYEFIKWDDDTQITENKNVKNFDLQSVNYNLHQERYTFITLTTFSAVYSIWGNNPIPFHLLSLIFHLLNIIIVFLLVKKLLNNINVIFLVTILFALHPLRVESVAWISEFKDLLFTFFSLISFLLYVKYLQTCKLRFLFLTSLFVLFSSFSKIQGLFVPISFLLFDFYFNRRFSLFLILEKILMLFAVFFVFQVKTYIILSLIFIVSYAFKARLKKIKLNNKQLKYVLFVFISILVAYTLFILIIKLVYGQMIKMHKIIFQ